MTQEELKDNIANISDQITELLTMREILELSLQESRMKENRELMESLDLHEDESLVMFDAAADTFCPVVRVIDSINIDMSNQTLKCIDTALYEFDSEYDSYCKATSLTFTFGQLKTMLNNRKVYVVDKKTSDELKTHMFTFKITDSNLREYQDKTASSAKHIVLVDF